MATTQNQVAICWLRRVTVCDPAKAVRIYDRGIAAGWADDDFTVLMRLLDK